MKLSIGLNFHVFFPSFWGQKKDTKMLSNKHKTFVNDSSNFQ